MVSTNSSSTAICPFCDDSQSYRYLAETSLTRAIYPKSPACDYHVLVTPKRHVQCFDELQPTEVQEIFGLLQRLAKVAKDNISDFIGYNLLSNNGSEAVNQRVKHCHMHIFLRTANETEDPLVGKSHDPMPLTDQQLQNVTLLKTWLQSTPVADTTA